MEKKKSTLLSLTALFWGSNEVKYFKKQKALGSLLKALRMLFLSRTSANPVWWLVWSYGSLCSSQADLPCPAVCLRTFIPAMPFAWNTLSSGTAQQPPWLPLGLCLNVALSERPFLDTIYKVTSKSQEPSMFLRACVQFICWLSD